MKHTSLTIILFLLGLFLYGQKYSTERDFKRIDLFPAISYSPETKLTLGGIGYYYFDLTQESPATQLSNINFLAVYTMAKQIAIETEWEIFSDDNTWRYRGEAFFNRYPDRNYGLGNDANILIADIENDVVDTLNYYRFNSDRIKFSPVVLRKIAPNLYMGLQADLEYLYRMRSIPDSYVLLNDAAQQLDALPVDGLRVGLGLNVLYDNRDYILNPLSGAYIEFSNHFYNGLLGSDFDFSNFLLDARKYINTTQNHTLALRGVVNCRFSDDPIPLRALSRVGGRDFIRGYFKGTYQDNHLLAYELEYRWPFWKEDFDAPAWKIWKRMGIVGFIGGAQVAHELDDFRMGRFNMAAGGGLRFLFNKSSRLNIRIDYGVGLSKHSAGPNERQSGLYFFLAEAF